MLITPHGELRLKVDDRGTRIWVWDDDEWLDAKGQGRAIPQPGLIDIRGEEVLYCVLTNKRTDKK